MTIKHIVVHCSDSPSDRGDTAKDIHRWHQERGFDGIGYHAVILPTGEIEQGRPHYWKGAHVKGHNHDSIGICLIGQIHFNDEQKAALRDLIHELLRKYPKADVVGHCDLDPKKTCPNFDVKDWWLHG